VVGQISPWKGQDDAIRILALVREQIPDARLRLIGSVVFSGGVAFDNHAYHRRLAELSVELGVRDAVGFDGPTEDLESVFGSIDVLLVPSWEEPFGRVVAEAMAAGVPVVATDRGGPAELIEDGVSGHLLAPRDPGAWADLCVRVLSDAAARTDTGEHGRRRVITLLDRRTSVERVLRMYRETSRGPRPRPSVERRHRSESERTSL
jgi:glycosyltransferase involved in cell wall biosynthesis